MLGLEAQERKRNDLRMYYQRERRLDRAKEDRGASERRLSLRQTNLGQVTLTKER